MEIKCNIHVWNMNIDDLISKLISEKKKGFKKASITKV